MVDRKKLMDNFQRKLATVVASGSPQIVFLIGDYGLGKTYALLQLKDRIKNSPDFSNLSAAVSIVYMKIVSPKPPGEYLTYMYSQIVTDLGRSFFEDLAQKYQKLSETDQEKLELETMFSRALKSFKKSDAAWSYLRGLAISATDAKELEIRGRIARDSDAMAALFSLLRLLNKTGKKSLLILIDEFEYLLTAAGEKRATQIIMTFKDLYDRITEQNGSSIANPVFLIASAPGAYRELPSLAGKVGMGGVYPFLSRVYDTLYLDPFSKEETHQLLETRLERRRIGVKQRSIFPFTKDYVSFIATRCKGNPRLILHYSAVVLDEANVKKLRGIGAKDAKKILDEHGLP